MISRPGFEKLIESHFQGRRNQQSSSRRLLERKNVENGLDIQNRWNFDRESHPPPGCLYPTSHPNFVVGTTQEVIRSTTRGPSSDGDSIDGDVGENHSEIATERRCASHSPYSWLITPVLLLS